MSPIDVPVPLFVPLLKEILSLKLVRVKEENGPLPGKRRCENGRVLTFLPKTVSDILKMELAENALKVLKVRYLLRNEQGDVIKTPERLFRCVASAIASAENLYGNNVSS